MAVYPRKIKKKLNDFWPLSDSIIVTNGGKSIKLLLPIIFPVNVEQGPPPFSGGDIDYWSPIQAKSFTKIKELARQGDLVFDFSKQ